MGSSCSRQSEQPKRRLSENTHPSIVDGFVYQRGTCALEYYEPIKELGQGSISSIHLVRKRKNRVKIPYREKVDIMSLAKTNNPSEVKDKVYALKSIIKEYVGNEKFLEEMRSEVHTMSRLSHPNLVKVYEAYERKRHIYLIMEYCPGGDLWPYATPDSSESATAGIVRQLLQAVSYLHSHDVVHRDLKLENVMVDGHGIIKVIDFGLATRYLSSEKKQMTDRVGTLYSMAPQVLQGIYDQKCDIWSVGVVAYILLSGGRRPFWGPEFIPWEHRKQLMVDKIMRCKYEPMIGTQWRRISEEGKLFCQALLKMNPKKRPGADQALNHVWLTSSFEDDETSCSALNVQNFLRKLKEVINSNHIDTEALRASFEGRAGDVESTMVPIRDLIHSIETLCPEIFSVWVNLKHEVLSVQDEIVSFDDFLVECEEITAHAESDRMTRLLSELTASGDVYKKELIPRLKEAVTERTFSRIECELEDTPDNEIIPCNRIWNLLTEIQQRAKVPRVKGNVDSESSHSWKHLADGENTLIPGGRSLSESERLRYIYDEVKGDVELLG